jgi:DNA-binding phage protein
MEANGILRAHTVRCLLGTPGTVIGKRKPTFDSILKVANAAGFDLVLQNRKAR